MPLIGTRGAASAQGFGMFAAVGLPAYLASLYTGIGSSSAVDSSSNAYTYGWISSTGNVTLAKYNSGGTLQWEKEVATSGAIFNRVTTDSAGNVLTATPFSSSQLQVTKLDSSGTAVWQKRVNGWTPGCSGVNVQCAAIATDTSNNVYVATPVYQSCEYILSVLKLDSSGAMQWSRKVFTGLQASEVVGVASNSSGDVYAVCGHSVGGAYRGLLVKYNTSGTLQWQRSMVGDTASNNYLRDVAVDSSGNVYVTGISNWGGASQRMFVAKYDSSGTNLWARELYSGSVPVLSYGLAVDSSGNVYACGYFPYSYIMCMAKWNSSGVIQWQRQLVTTGTRKTYGYDVSVGPDGLPVFIGYSTNSSNADQKYLVAKLPADGSKTGTYTLAGDSYTYSATTFTEAAFAGTLANGGASSTTLGLASSNNTQTVTNSSMTSAVTLI